MTLFPFSSSVSSSCPHSAPLSVSYTTPFVELAASPFRLHLQGGGSWIQPRFAAQIVSSPTAALDRR
ncbi:hypothetical protein SETIT_9G286000v2 [Setaria italica]|uniref:Uncharacterized protein n=1 Tax=Setaria italica TaxID=4555 RepID=A0A368SLM1_SETIT|nr:hypothetical protein SETIT_9G286000v2 [Setaria italica]